MTDKEWYAQLSTMVLEGIDNINKEQPTWRNKEDIRQFVEWNKLPGEDKQEKIKKIKWRIADALMFVGYGMGLILGIVDGIAWLMFMCGDAKLSVPLALLLGAAGFGVIGLAAQIWDDLI